MGTFSLADSHHKKVVFLILYTVQCRDFWLHCIEVLQEEKKEERDVVVDRVSWSQMCALQVTENIFKSLTFQVSVMDRNRAQKVILREDFIFPIFYN